MTNKKLERFIELVEGYHHNECHGKMTKKEMKEYQSLKSELDAEHENLEKIKKYLNDYDVPDYGLVWHNALQKIIKEKP